MQDAAAALPARLLAVQPGERVLDLCAAPGGKTAQLAAAGGVVTAVERDPARMGTLKGNLARLGLNAETVLADAATWRPATKFPAILLDAPCSATGTIRRHPDLLHLRKAARRADADESPGRPARRRRRNARPGRPAGLCRVLAAARGRCGADRRRLRPARPASATR